MEAPAFARHWLARVLAILGAYGTLVGLGLLPLPAAAVAVVLGQLSGQLTVALAIALVVSLIANVALVVFVSRNLQRRVRHDRAGRSRASSYATPGELDTILLTSADLEAWWANAIAAARERVGPDARAYVDSIHIDMPFIVFRGQSQAASKAFSGTVGGPQRSDVSWYGVYRITKLWKSEPSPPLWRTDDTWLDLLKKAWLREKPVRALCVLHERGTSDSRYWELTFGPYFTDDERWVADRHYVLRNGELEVRTDR